MTERNYAQLQEIHEKYGPQGLEILAFPCNSFGGQEPGTNADVKAYVEGRGVGFKVLGLIKCDNNADTHPLFAGLKEATGGQGLGWNFHKYLCDADGLPVSRSRKDPNDLIPEIEELLKAKA